MLKYFVCILWCASAAAEGPAGIEKLQAYQGTWKIDTEHFATQFSKASKESTTLRNDCWRSAGFFVCDQFVDGDSKALLVFTYDAAHDVYQSHPIMPSGEGGGGGKLIIKGNVWTFPWEDKQDGKTVYYQVVNTFTTPKTIEFRQEFSEDKIHWTVTAKGIEKKQE